MSLVRIAEYEMHLFNCSMRYCKTLLFLWQSGEERCIFAGLPVKVRVTWPTKEILCNTTRVILIPNSQKIFFY